jgi:adenylate kinase family enzyme
MSRLVKDYDIAFVSTGDVLRKEIMAKSEVGKRAEEVVANGGESMNYLTIQYKADNPGLVPDELMLDVVKAELDRLKGKVSFDRRAVAQS